MATPPFIVKLREKIGNDPLWLMGITAYVVRQDGRILLGKRSDTGQWALVYGIIEPGEQPATTCVREVKEETNVDVIPTRLASVRSSNQVVTYANGDQTRYLDMMFICEPNKEGCVDPSVNDDESSDVGWFALDSLPSPLASSTIERIEVMRAYRKRCERGDTSALFWCDDLLDF